MSSRSAPRDTVRTAEWRARCKAYSTAVPLRPRASPPRRRGGASAEVGAVRFRLEGRAGRWRSGRAGSRGARTLRARHLPRPLAHGVAQLCGDAVHRRAKRASHPRRVEHRRRVAWNHISGSARFAAHMGQDGRPHGGLSPCTKDEQIRLDRHMVAARGGVVAIRRAGAACAERRFIAEPSIGTAAMPTMTVSRRSPHRPGRRGCQGAATRRSVPRKDPARGAAPPPCAGRASAAAPAAPGVRPGT